METGMFVDVKVPSPVGTKIVCNLKENTSDAPMIRKHGIYFADPDNKGYKKFTLSENDVPSLLNLENWGTKTALYNKKLGIKPMVERTFDDEMLNLRKVLEPFLENAVTRLAGHKKDQIVPDPYLYEHEKYGFMIAEPKRYLFHQGEQCLMQIQPTISQDFKKIEGLKKGILPIKDEYKMRWSLAVMNLNTGYILYSWGYYPDDFVLIRVERNKQIENYLIEQAEKFISDLENKIPPNRDEEDPELALEEIQNLFGTDIPKKEVKLDSSFFKEMKYLSELTGKKEELKKQKKEIEKMIEGVDSQINATLVPIMEESGGAELIACKNEAGDEYLEFKYKQVVTSRVNSSRLKDEMPEVYDLYQEQKVSRRGPVLVKKATEGGE